MCFSVFFCVCYSKSEINVNQWILVKMTKLKSDWRKYIQRLSWNEWTFRWKYIHSKSNLIHDSKLFYQIDMRYKQVSSNWTFFFDLGILSKYIYREYLSHPRCSNYLGKVFFKVYHLSTSDISIYDMIISLIIIKSNDHDITKTSSFKSKGKLVYLLILSFFVRQWTWQWLMTRKSRVQIQQGRLLTSIAEYFK